MRLNEITDRLKLEKATKHFDGNKDISGAYTSDLLSDVMANAKKDNIWITLQTHLNIIAVASLKEIAAIIIVVNKEIDKDMIEKAESEKISVLKTSMTAYQTSGKIYELGIR
jgi:hypothetical protein